MSASVTTRVTARPRRRTDGPTDRPTRTPGHRRLRATAGPDWLGDNASQGLRELGIEILSTGRFYDYESKYAPGGSQHLLPAPILPFVYQEVRRLALAAHRALGCRGVSRADFRFDDALDAL